MALVKHNNNSISDITSAGQLAQGKMTLISEQTASGSASISFTSGIDRPILFISLSLLIFTHQQMTNSLYLMVQVILAQTII